jgi:signal transduction histidine kinase
MAIEDTGIGIKKDDQVLLFQDFVRIKNEKTKLVTGSGLGLSIAKKIVGLYNGTIDMESEPDVGSKFTIKIPVTS